MQLIESDNRSHFGRVGKHEVPLSKNRGRRTSIHLFFVSLLVRASERFF